jgi:hypothetical protein
MKRYKFYIHAFLLSAVLVFSANSCTDLDEEVFSETTGDLFFSNPDNLISGFGVAYTNLYDLVGHKFGLVGMDVGTDLLCVPQRGGDWFDGGEWHRFHRQTWTPKEGYIDRWWNICFRGVNLCNQLIFTFKNIDSPDVPKAIAELRAFRALYYYWLVDIYGNVPILDTYDVPAGFLPSTSSRAKVYEFIEKELLEVKDLLSKETGLATYGRVNHYVAWTILAKLYMNAEVYTGTAQWDKAEKALDTLIQSQVFALTPNFSDNFVAAPYGSKEIIMAVPYDQKNATGFEIHLFSLHYNLQKKYGLENLPWNGLCAQESLYKFFETGDVRLGSLLYGKQVDADGKQIDDPSYEKFNPSNPTAPRDPDGIGLNLTPAINMLEPNCLRQAGARLFKWPLISGSDRYISNDFPIFRYADILLLKAEVLLRKPGGDAAAAAGFVNQVRARSKASNLATVTLQNIIDERARELFAEGHRRSDMIRFGTYANQRWEKPATDLNCVKLWPIPENQLQLNPNLQQNPCY